MCVRIRWDQITISVYIICNSCLKVIAKYSLRSQYAMLPKGLIILGVTRMKTKIHLFRKTFVWYPTNVGLLETTLAANPCRTIAFPAFPCACRTVVLR